NESSSIESLLGNRKNLLENDEKFRITEAYAKADSNKKEAYEKAIKELKELSDLSESDENNKLLSEKLKNVIQAKNEIDEKNLAVEDSKNAQKKLDIDK